MLEMDVAVKTSAWSAEQVNNFFNAAVQGKRTVGIKKSKPRKRTYALTGLVRAMADDLQLAEGFQYEVLIQWGDIINRRQETFGFNNNYIGFVPGERADEALIMVNHEYIHSLLVSEYDGEITRTIGQIKREMDAVGASVLKLRHVKNLGRWEVVFDDPQNRRVTAETPVPLISPRPITGGRMAVGSMGNESGDVTPWGSMLSCEASYTQFYGEAHYEGAERVVELGRYGWERFYERPPEHYGWIMEYDPKSRELRKLTSTGRLAHKFAAVRITGEDKCNVYFADSGPSRYLYKFVSSRSGSLERGHLYAADLRKGRWLPLDVRHNDKLKERFRDQTELLIRAREAAELAGATKLLGMQDGCVDPVNGTLVVTLSGGRHEGVMRLVEKDNNPNALQFETTRLEFPENAAGLVYPDQVKFDSRGNLWITSNAPREVLGKMEFHEMGGNALFVIPREGSHAGEVIRIAGAPGDSAFKGLQFDSRQETLFLSVQHPGETTDNINEPSSRWPNGGLDLPRPSVVTISGPALGAAWN